MNPLPHPLFRGRLQVAVAVVAACAAAVGASAITWHSLRSESLRFVPETELTIESFRVALGEAGLSADVLAAAGVAPEAVGNIIDAAFDHLNTHPWPQSAATIPEHNASVQMLEKSVQSGRGSSETVTSLGHGRTALSTAQSAKSSAADALFTAATVGLTEPQRAALSALRGSNARDLPLKYRVVTRTEEQVIELRDALAHARIVTGNGGSVESEAAAVVATADAAAATQTAVSGLNALVSIKAAWNSAVAEAMQ